MKYYIFLIFLFFSVIFSQSAKPDINSVIDLKEKTSHINTQIKEVLKYEDRDFRAGPNSTMKFRAVKGKVAVVFNGITDPESKVMTVFIDPVKGTEALLVGKFNKIDSDSIKNKNFNPGLLSLLKGELGTTDEVIDFALNRPDCFVEEIKPGEVFRIKILENNFYIMFNERQDNKNMFLFNDFKSIAASYISGDTLIYVLNDNILREASALTFVAMVILDQTKNYSVIPNFYNVYETNDSIFFPTNKINLVMNPEKETKDLNSVSKNVMEKFSLKAVALMKDKVTVSLKKDASKKSVFKLSDELFSETDLFWPEIVVMVVKK